MIIRPAKRTLRVEESFFLPCNSLTPSDGASINARSYGGTDKVGFLPNRHTQCRRGCKGPRSWPGCPLVHSLGICPSRPCAQRLYTAMGQQTAWTSNQQTVGQSRLMGPGRKRILCRRFLGRIPGVGLNVGLETRCSAPEARGRAPWHWMVAKGRAFGSDQLECWV